MSPAFRNDPYPYYERFRGPAPLLRVADTIWFALGHADVTALLRHPRLSTDETAHAATEDAKKEQAQTRVQQAQDFFDALDKQAQQEIEKQQASESDRASEHGESRSKRAATAHRGAPSRRAGIRALERHVL